MGTVCGVGVGQKERERESASCLWPVDVPQCPLSPPSVKMKLLASLIVLFAALACAHAYTNTGVPSIGGSCSTYPYTTPLFCKDGSIGCFTSSSYYCCGCTTSACYGCSSSLYCPSTVGSSCKTSLIPTGAGTRTSLLPLPLTPLQLEFY